jgi:hypothetical protein
MMRWFLCAGVSAALTSCTTIVRPPCVALNAQASYCLQHPSALGEFTALQRVDFHWQDRTETTLTEIECDASTMRMAVLTPMGQKLLEVRYAPPRVEQLAGPASRLDPAMLIALVQMALWPADNVQAGLRGPVEWRSGNGNRQLFVSGKPLVEMEFDGTLPYPERLTMRIESPRMQLDIRTLHDEAAQ